MTGDISQLKGMTFLKPIEHIANMFNGQLRVIFTDETDVVLNIGKRGPVLPRRKRAHARSIGAIK